jgi:hypothetical protein
MNSLHATTQAPLHATRIVLGTLAALVLLAAASAAAATTPITSDQFAPGWQAHAMPLINMGITTHVPGKTKWYVPAMLRSGDYVLVKRQGDKAELIDGYRFTVRPGNSNVYLFLAPGYSDVEALPVADVPSAKPVPGAGALR